MKADIPTPSEISLSVDPKRSSGLAPEPAVALLSVIGSACDPLQTFTEKTTTLKMMPADSELYRRIDEVVHYLWGPIGISESP